MGAVEEEDVFLVRGDGHFRLTGFECFDEDGGHFEETAVVEIAVVVGSVSLHELRLRRGVCRADIVGLAVVVPGDDLDVVGLELQELHPAVNVDVGVLRVKPIGITRESLEEPGGYAGHPDLAGGVAGVGEGFVDGSFLRGGEGRMDPSEGACATVGE